MIGTEVAMWTERLELEPPDARRLVWRQGTWAAVQGLAFGALAWAGHADGLGLGVAVAIGAAATRPARVYLLPILVVFVVAATVALGAFGVPHALAAGAAAGLVVGTGSALARLEAVLAGVAGAGLGAWGAAAVAPPLGPVAVGMWTGAVVGLCVAQALLPGAIRSVATDQIPSPGRIQAALGAAYRPPCMRAWQIDQEIARQAPDKATRRGLAEVAGWVYRLALTLQTLDADLARIDPAEVRTRRDALLWESEGEDPFIRERRIGTAQHLARMLEHRDALALERARAASLQEYALAYLEEARAGLALARVLPGERTPESLGTVLEKLRTHARESGARRSTARELEGIRA